MTSEYREEVNINVQDIITRVQRTFGDEAGVQIKTSDLITWINDAQEAIVQENKTLMETSATANSVINQADYSLPTDLAVFRSLQYKGSRVKLMTFNEFNEYLDGYNSSTNTVGPGIPTVFMIYAGKMTVFPVPSEAIAGGFKIYYTRHPVQVSTTADTPELPVEYHQAIVDYCLQRAYELDEDSEKYAMKQASFKNRVDLLNNRNTENNEYYPKITILPQDDIGGYHPYGWGY